jgi:hypothetical protein
VQRSDRGAIGGHRGIMGNTSRLSCDLRLHATPLHIALPYIAGDLPLGQCRSSLVSQREIQEVSRVDLARKMWIGPPPGNYGPSPAAARTIYTESIMSKPRASRRLAAVDNLLRPNHCSPAFLSSLLSIPGRTIGGQQSHASGTGICILRSRCIVAV